MIPILPLLLVGGGIAALAMAGKKGTGSGGDIEATAQAMLARETDPVKLREFASDIRKQDPVKYGALANQLETKANALAVGGPGAGTPYVPNAPPQASPPPYVPPPQASPLPQASPPFTPSVPGNTGIAGGLGAILGGVASSPLPSFPVPTVPTVPTVPMPTSGGVAAWNPGTLPKLPPIPAAGRQKTPAHRKGQTQLAAWSKAVEGGAYGPSEADGVIGPVTQAATQRFQAWANQFLSARLTLDGLFGPDTYAALDRFTTTAAQGGGGTSGYWAGRPAV